MSIILSFPRNISVSPETAFLYFTTPTLLQDWFCDTFAGNVRVGGSYYAAWAMGYYASGRYSVVEPNQRLVMTWDAPNLPSETIVEVVFKPGSIEVRHSEIGDDWKPQEQEIREGWMAALDNLNYTLETGLDYRLMSRPMLGVFSQPLPEQNMPVRQGIYLAGVVAGMGAEAAGLQAGDIIVSINGKPVSDQQPLSAAVAGRKGGEVVPVEFYRDGQKQTVQMTLTQRAMPDAPVHLPGMIEFLEKTHADLDRELDELIAGTSHEEMHQRPRADEWSGNEILAHLIWTERDLHTRLWLLNSNGDFTDWPSNEPLHIAGVLASYPTTELLVAELKRAEAATRAMTALLPESMPKALLGRLAQHFPGNAEHTRSHFTQIREALDVVRQNSGITS